MKIKFSLLVVLLLLILIMIPAFVLWVTPVQAVDIWGGQQNEINNQLQLGEKDPRAIVGAVINVALGFLGIIAVIIVLYGGFLWMTAAGNEDQIAKAKKLLTAGIIGIVIILAAWGLALFVLDALLNATGAP